MAAGRYSAGGSLRPLLTPLPPPAAPRDRRARRASLVVHLVLAAMAAVPLLLTARGRVAADTKVYLALDPGRLLSRATSMWDPNVGFGTVTHQNIGYLFPMGPWFWVFDRIGAPDWVAQRAWVATFLFAAGAGVLFLLRTLEPRRHSPVAGFAGASVYLLTPYVLQYGTRTSVLLLPWAGLPWLVGLTQRALRTGSWRHPASFALVVTAVGGVNATALVLAGLGPLSWVAFAVWVHRDVTPRRAAAAIARIGALTTACSLWWVAGLAVQGRFGINVLRYSETVSTVAATSLASEVLRGLGYWFFYGGDKVGPWNEHVRRYVGVLWLMAASFTTPALALAAATIFRWRHRAYFVTLVVLGTAVAVGAYPYDDPSPIGALFKGFSTSSTAGLAMRSTPRAVPLVVLGLAGLVGGAVQALAASRRPRLAVAAAGLVVAVAAVGLAPLWSGDFLDRGLLRDEDVPAYWLEAAAYLDDGGDPTRVLEVPGSDFAAYRWGQTSDPVTPGLMDRPYAARELIPLGSPATADLLNAFDRRFQEGLVDVDAIAAVARRMAAGDVVLRSDLQYERFLTPRPRQTWALFDPPPPGLGAPVTFGEPRPNRAIPRLPLLDELDLVTPAGRPDPPPVAVFPVTGARPIVDSAPGNRPVLLAGDGEGLVQAAAVGVLDGARVVVYSGALAGRPDERRRLLDAGAELVVTDSNRKRARQWNRLTETFGFTEPVGHHPLREDAFDNRLPVFPDAGDDAFTTAVHRGVRSVTATSYGNPVTYTPENRAANALDGDVETAWRAGDFSDVTGERLVIDLAAPVTVEEIGIVQPRTGPRNRFITSVRVRLDGRDIGTFDLDERSRTVDGQALPIGARSFSTAELEVVGDNVGDVPTYAGQSPVGFAEVRIGDVTVDEVVKLPTDLLTGAGPGSAAHDLRVLVERVRWNPSFTARVDEELAMVREVELPTARRFSLEGEARLSAFAPSTVIDEALGIPAAGAGGLTVRSSSSLHGSLADRGSSAVDGDRTTAWRTAFREQNLVGAWIEVDASVPMTVDRLDLAVVADGRHSVPTRVRIEGGGEARTVDLPLVPDGPEPGAVATVPVTFPPLTASTVRVTVERVRPATSIDYYEERPIQRPLAIAEVGLPGVTLPAPRPTFEEAGCRSDLLTVDGRPLAIRLRGTAARATAREALAVELCDEEAIDLGPGAHVLRAAPGKRSGIDLDSLSLRSAGSGDRPAAPSAAAPEVGVVDAGRTSYRLRVRDVDGPFWIVLRQSHNAGWTARAAGLGDLGPPLLVDGFANAWPVDPGGARDLRIDLEWTPQRGVRLALWLSALAFGLALVLAVVTGRGGWRRITAEGDEAGSPVLASPLRYPAAASPGVRGAAAAVLCGLAGALVVTPAVGLVVLVASVGAVASRRWGRVVLTGGAVLCFAAAAALVVGRQWWGEGPSADFTWPARFHSSHLLAWLALLLLSADVVIGRAVRRPVQERGSRG